MSFDNVMYTQCAIRVECWNRQSMYSDPQYQLGLFPWSYGTTENKLIDGAMQKFQFDIERKKFDAGVIHVFSPEVVGPLLSMTNLVYPNWTLLWGENLITMLTRLQGAKPFYEQKWGK